MMLDNYICTCKCTWPLKVENVTKVVFNVDSTFYTSHVT